MKKLMLILVLIFAGNIIMAQNDSIFKEFEKDFDAFKKLVDDEFNTFKEQNDSAFQHFLESTWKEFDVFRKTRPVFPKPIKQPVIIEKRDTSSKKIQYISPIAPDLSKKQEKQFEKLNESESIEFNSRVVACTFDYFGVKKDVYYNSDKLPKLDQLNENSIKAFYNELAATSYLWNYNLSGLEKMKESYRVNDWGYYLILKKAAESIFPGKNEQVLFIWYGFVKSGFLAKVGYDKNRIYLLLPTQQSIFDNLYLSEKGINYYLFDSEEKEPGQIKTYQGNNVKDARIFSFKLEKLPLFDSSSIKSHQISYNQQKLNLKFNSELIEYLSTFPQCELSTYFGTPISPEAAASLDDFLVPLLNNKTNREKVDLLLDFIQKSIKYKTDQEQFGKERYMFAEECLFYPFADCEDRSNLLAELVKRYTGLPSIGLNFPEHVALAVHFFNDNSGTYISFGGLNYVVCDPTYINAKSGMLMVDLQNKKPKIIQY